jgi:MoxR-like ATPase
MDELNIPDESNLENANNENTNIEKQFHNRIDVTPAQNKINEVLQECQKAILGQNELLELMIVCIISDGHILLEGVPGIAKTLSARTMAKAIKADFARIQFTPDLLPSDIIGTSIYDMKLSEFEFKQGPIFSNVILIDEINRAPAKTQAALFEVMEEKQISFDGKEYQMEHPFIVIATQNPIEQEGTYRLPEAQLDRFLMKLNLTYPSRDTELDILKQYKNQLGKITLENIRSLMSSDDIKNIQKILAEIYMEDQLLGYIADITQETRNHSKLYLGASPRASLAMMKASKVVAVMQGRDFVLPDDIQYVCPHVLNHRLILSPDAEMEGTTTFNVIDDILSSLEVPR